MVDNSGTTRTIAAKENLPKKDADLCGVSLLRFRARGMKYSVLKGIMTFRDIFRPYGEKEAVDGTSIKDIVDFAAAECTHPPEESFSSIMRGKKIARQ